MLFLQLQDVSVVLSLFGVAEDIYPTECPSPKLFIGFFFLGGGLHIQS